MKLGFFSVLGIVFIVLKLCGIISWSWLWVTSPFWIGFIFFVVCLTFVTYLGSRKF